MNALGKYSHDFPRLAQESGYKFRLHRGEVNWKELDKVDTQGIIHNRDFQLLEENLIHVINCNLEKEFDVSAFNDNFIKLFKLAQLGVDYLSYCELYLDRCVILLQEQLSSLQEQCLSLTEENKRKDEELKRNKLKIKLQSQNYKCNKCEKIFLNETYLKSHERRRHQNSTDSNAAKTFKNQMQQTEEEIITVSVFTQTVDNRIPGSDNKDFLKTSDQELKIDNLKRDLEELKSRLSLAEKTMEEKKNDDKNFQNSFPNAIIPVIHSYISPQRNGYIPVSGTTAVVQGFPSQFILQEDSNECHETARKENKLYFQEFPEHNNSDRHILKEIGLDQRSVIGVNTAPDATLESTGRNQEAVSKNTYGNMKNNPPHSPPQRLDTLASKSVALVEEIQPVTNITKNETKNKTKKLQLNLEPDDIGYDSDNSVWSPSFFVPNSDAKPEPGTTSENIQISTSTPFKIMASPVSKIHESGFKNKWRTALSPTNGHPIKRKSKSVETAVHDIGSCDSKEKSKSLLRKIVTKKSPKIQELKSNLKSSFSQLYESVSSTVKKNSDSEPEKSKTEIVEGLHDRLKELGIDPEWPGIPKETMKQKLRILEHRRNLLTKENRLYPFLRRKLEKHVLKRIQSNSLSSEKQTAQMSDGLDLQKDEENNGTRNVLPIEITIYNSDEASESDILEFGKEKKRNFSGGSETENKNVAYGSLKVASQKKDEERETTDFSIFQAGKFKEGKAKVIELEVTDEILQNQKLPNGQEEPQTDSDFDDELFKHFEEQSIQSIVKEIAGKTETPNKDIIGSFPEKIEENDEFSNSHNVIFENQSILKSVSENNKLITKKKVLFVEEPEILETGIKLVSKGLVEKRKIASSVGDDDDWSIESEWTINNE